MAITTNKQSKLNQWFRHWLARRLPASKSITLAHKSIFILPTGFGVIWLMLVVLLFIFGTNYQNNLIIGLAFLLLSVFNTCIIYSYRNLAGIHFTAKPSPQNYAGEKLLYAIEVSAKYPQFDLQVNYPENTTVTLSEVNATTMQTLVPLANEKRGYVHPGRLKVCSRYPLGLCRTWSHLDLDNQQIVFPKPIKTEASLRALDEESQQSEKLQGKQIIGVDEYHGLKEYVVGESLRQVAWKQWAQGKGMLTKQFQQPQGAPLWLALTTDTSKDIETQLGELTWCVDQLSRKKQIFGLKLTAQTINPDSGENHRLRCLTALATYGQQSSGGAS
ncbi:DUF58 domain-containing protein [Shewanella sp. Scap07]|uniref:DUF58 domain-containing protein n=1 Tax=Shewanella sp. Scap07 TaxID=2589987 RepID=UPI0015BA8C67|nr:DUF58 domain-containing protein [Shewanella sp. Scap07]QLE85735.1 DUF58 domain-containing protein [Shewanella sp. Scap07]